MAPRSTAGHYDKDEQLEANADPTAGLPDGDSGPSSPSRWPATVFIVAVVVAFPLYLWLGRDQWFFLDDWDLLADRSARSVDDLLRPHNEHWMTLPILVYRALWAVVGLRSYVPYQIVSITLHLVAASLLWVVIRRAGVRPWIGTAAALPFLFFGSGRDNILWSFQMNFVGSLVAGLVHLILADHDGPWSRRDSIGLAFGFVGLLCSGLSVTMTIVVAIAVALRRGWRMAAWHSAPLALIFATWWVFYGRDAYTQPFPDVGEALKFVANAVTNLFDELGQLPLVGVLLGALAVAGIVVAWSRRRRELHGRLAAPAALGAGVAVYTLSTSLARWELPLSQGAQSGRYAHVLAAMVLPIVAVGADAVVARWRLATPAVVGVLLVGVPGNVAAAELHGVDRIVLGSRTAILSLPRSPIASKAPRDLAPLSGAPQATMGWLLDGERHHKFPAQALTPTERANATLRIALQPSTGETSGDCAPLDAPAERQLPEGGSLSFRGGDVQVQLRSADGSRSAFVTYAERNGSRLGALVGPLDLQIKSTDGATSVELCG